MREKQMHPSRQPSPRRYLALITGILASSEPMRVQKRPATAPTPLSKRLAAPPFPRCQNSDEEEDDSRAPRPIYLMTLSRVLPDSLFLRGRTTVAGIIDARVGVSGFWHISVVVLFPKCSDQASDLLILADAVLPASLLLWVMARPCDCFDAGRILEHSVNANVKLSSRERTDVDSQNPIPTC